MFENMEVGSTITFSYVEREEISPSLFPEHNHINYEVESFKGKVLNIRDLRVQPLAYSTIKRKSKSERSRYFLTVQLENGQVKSFYHNRMTNVKIKRKRKSFVGKIVDKLLSA